VRTFLSERTVVLTGSTGFLAKVFLEKLLWEQPDVRKVFLVIAPRGAQTAEDRLAKEIIAAPLFDRLRARHGDDFEAFARAKLVPVAGDLGVDGLGLSPEAESAIVAETDVVVHSAATTTFDERFDVAVNINTLGPRRVLALAKRCENLKVMCHVSTAFVNGLRVGRAAERAFRVGDSIAVELAEGKKKQNRRGEGDGNGEGRGPVRGGGPGVRRGGDGRAPR
jgi:fatty acyl-CoA reductase